MSDRFATSVVAASVVVAIALVATGVLLADRDPQDDASAPASAVVAAVPPQADGGTAKPGAPDPVEEEPQAGLPPVPSFDIVRVGPDGHAVMAGRAAPGADVAILDGGREIARVAADRRGEWVFLSEDPLPPGARELSLTARNPDGSQAEAETTVALVVPEAAGGQAVAVTLGRDGGRVLQGAARATDVGPLGIGAVSLLSDRRLAISGTAPPGADLHVYLDDRFLARVRAGDDGTWHLKAPAALEPREHIVRVDEVYWEGEVAARVEAPFDPTRAAGIGASEVVVAHGDTLWRIAEVRYGDGVQYFEIYIANAQQIRDPDVIYPGQVITLPPVAGEEAGVR